MLFDAGDDGKSAHEEDLHVNRIAKRTITVDGNLDDWQGVLPQTIKVETASGPTLTEQAWRPFEKFDVGAATGFALGYLAYDDNYFYFAAKVADSTPDGGTMRFETRDDDQFFYPEKCKGPKRGQGAQKSQGGEGVQSVQGAEAEPPSTRRYRLRSWFGRKACAAILIGRSRSSPGTAIPCKSPST